MLPVLFLTLGACNKFLDVIPKGVVIPTTLEDYEALLSAPLEMTRTSSNILHLTDELILEDDLRATANSMVSKSAVKAYDFENDLYDSNEDDPDWNIAYRTIYIANTVLAGLETNTENDQEKKNRIKGEALVHRGYTYLTLVNEYAKHFNSATAAADPGVPMPLKPDINALPGRSTVKEVYDQIEKDLLEAASLLYENSRFTYRPNKASAFGTLARMYLYKSDWQKAFDYADKAFKISNYIHDFNTFQWLDPSDKALSTLIGYPSATVDKKDIVLHKYLHIVTGYGFGFLVSPAQYDLFEEGDLRREFGTSDKDWYGTTLPHPGVLETRGVYDYNNAGITTSELLLIRAEALARMNDYPAAMADLNYLREKRFETALYKPLSASSGEEALDLVLLERRIELAFSGLRLFDIKRLNAEGRNIRVTHGDKTLQPDDPRFIIPIPSKILSLNSNIVPNPRCHNRN